MTDTKTVAPAPEFTATDAAGRQIRLADYKGREHVVLVFNRGFQ